MVFLELLSTLTQQVEQGCGEVIVERRGTEEENYGRVERHHTDVKSGRATWGSVPQCTR